MSLAGLRRILDDMQEEAPEPVERGRATLERVLAWTSSTAWPEVAWTFSALAGGSPVELVWRPGRPGLYWTAEPAGPEVGADDRLQVAFDIAASLGAHLDRAEASRALAGGSSPWPAWVSGRHRGETDAAKLYLQVSGPGASEAFAEARLGPSDSASLLGLSAANVREFYWLRRVRQPGDVFRMALDRSRAPLVHALDRALIAVTGAGLDADKAGSLGLSVRLTGHGDVAALAAFVRPWQVGDKRRLHGLLMRAGGEINPALGRAWLAQRLVPLLLTIAVAPHRPPELSLGFGVAAPRASG